MLNHSINVQEEDTWGPIWLKENVKGAQKLRNVSNVEEKNTQRLAIIYADHWRSEWVSEYDKKE